MQGTGGDISSSSTWRWFNPSSPLQRLARADAHGTGSAPARNPCEKSTGSGCNFGKYCLNSFALFNSNRAGCRWRGARKNQPGQAVFLRDEPGHLWGTPKEVGQGKKRGRRAVTCLPFLQETPGLVRTNRLMSPKLVLDVLVTKGFKVWGQNAVQQQNAPIQGPDTRSVRGRHSAARGLHTAPAQRDAARQLQAGF